MLVTEEDMTRSYLKDGLDWILGNLYLVTELSIIGIRSLHSVSTIALLTV